jgi:hypothetical protein
LSAHTSAVKVELAPSGATVDGVSIVTSLESVIVVGDDGDEDDDDEDDDEEELHAATPRTASIKIVERKSFMLASHKFLL